MLMGRSAIRGLLLSINWMFGKQKEHETDPNDLGAEGGPP